MEEHDLLADCPAWAGIGEPRRPESIMDGVRAAAASGFSGIGIGADDLSAIRATVGFRALARVLDDAGVVWVQVGAVDRWWQQDADDLRGVVLEAAATLRAGVVRAVAAPSHDPLDRLRLGWTALAAQTAGIGAQLALVPRAGDRFATAEHAARFVIGAGHANGGILLNADQALATGSTLGSLSQGVPPTALFAVSLGAAGRDVRGQAGSVRAFDAPGLVRVARDLGFEEPWGVDLAPRVGESIADSARIAAAAARAQLDAADAVGLPPAPVMPRTAAPASAVDFGQEHIASAQGGRA